MRLVVLGGSGSSTPELIDAIEAWPHGADRRPPVQLVLWGRHAERLATVARECSRRASPLSNVDVEATTDRRRALDGADVVLNQVRIGGLAARLFDETFPWEYELPGEETMGPGGVANALRTVPALLDVWSDVEACTSAALVINLTNPSGIVTNSARRRPALQVVSVCDSPTTLCAQVAERLGRDEAEVRHRYVGMNHVGWYVPIDDGELAVIADLATGEDRADVAMQGALPAPYVRYYVHPRRILAEQRGKATRAEALLRLEADLLADYAAGSLQPPRRGAVWYAKAVLPLIDGWLHGSDEALILGLPNDGAVAGLPTTAIVERAVRTEPVALVPVNPPQLPAMPFALLAAHAWYEEVAVGTCSADLTVERISAVLLANPLVTDVELARAMARAILERATAFSE